MFTFILFIIILSTLVLCHELGHYVAAKKSGVCVEEFGIGLPPRLYGKKIGETIYSVNVLPFGGFVKLTGEDPSEVDRKDLTNPKSFLSKAPLQKIVMLGAGIFMNLTLAVVLYYVLLFMTGFKSLEIPMVFEYDFKFGRMDSINTVVMSVLGNSAAQEAQLEIGEAILEIDGVSVNSVSDVRSALKDKVDQGVELTVVDLKAAAKPTRVITLVPQANEEGEGILGVYLAKSVTIHYEKLYEKLLAGPLHAVNMTAYSGVMLSKLVGISVAERDISPVSDNVAGPVGIYSVIKGVLDYSEGKVHLSLLNFVALMSLTLGVMNLLPFPALDGGRIFFVLLDKLSGKRINPLHEATLHRWGMIILLGVLLLVTLKDITRFF